MLPLIENSALFPTYDFVTFGAQTSTIQGLHYLCCPEHPVLQFGPFQNGNSILFAGLWHLMSPKRKVIISRIDKGISMEMHVIHHYFQKEPTVCSDLGIKAYLKLFESWKLSDALVLFNVFGK